MTPKSTEEKTPLDRAGDLARSLREILWLIGFIATAFGAFMYWSLRPMRADLELIKRELSYQTKLTELNSTLWVEPDSTALLRAHRELRELRRFIPLIRP